MPCRADSILVEAMATGNDRWLGAGSVHQTASQSASLRERVTALYEAHREPIFRFLVGHGLDPAVAQEVTQDVFVDLLTF